MPDIDRTELQHQLALKIFDEKLSVRETEKLIKKLLQDKEEAPKEEKDRSLDYIYQDIADQMKQIFGTKSRNSPEKPG